MAPPPFADHLNIFVECNGEAAKFKFSAFYEEIGQRILFTGMRMRAAKTYQIVNKRSTFGVCQSV